MRCRWVLGLGLVFGCGDDGGSGGSSGENGSTAAMTAMMTGSGSGPSGGSATPDPSGSTDPTTVTSGGSSGMPDGTSDDGGSSGAEAETTAAPEFDVQDKYGRQFIQYARVMKTDDVPKLWISADSIDAVPAEGDLPDGTFIIREEGDPEVNWIFIREKIDGVWWQGNFFPDDISFDTAPEGNACAPCHPSTPDATFSLLMLQRFRTTGILQETGCDESTNQPCPFGTYD